MYQIFLIGVEVSPEPNTYYREQWEALGIKGVLENEYPELAGKLEVRKVS